MRREVVDYMCKEYPDGSRLMDLLPLHSKLDWQPDLHNVPTEMLVIGSMKDSQGEEDIVAKLAVQPTQVRVLYYKMSKATGRRNEQAKRHPIKREDFIAKHNVEITTTLTSPFKYIKDVDASEDRKFAALVRWFFIDRRLLDRQDNDMSHWYKNFVTALRSIEGEMRKDVPEPEAPSSDTQDAMDQKAKFAGDDGLDIKTYLIDRVGKDNGLKTACEAIPNPSAVTFGDQNCTTRLLKKRLFIGQSQKQKIYAYLSTQTECFEVEFRVEGRSSTSAGPSMEINADLLGSRSSYSLSHPFNLIYRHHKQQLAEEEITRLKTIVIWYFIMNDIWEDPPDEDDQRKASRRDDYIQELLKVLRFVSDKLYKERQAGTRSGNATAGGASTAQSMSMPTTSQTPTSVQRLVNGRATSRPEVSSTTRKVPDRLSSGGSRSSRQTPAQPASIQIVDRTAPSAYGYRARSGRGQAESSYTSPYPPVSHEPTVARNPNGWTAGRSHIVPNALSGLSRPTPDDSLSDTIRVASSSMQSPPVRTAPVRTSTSRAPSSAAQGPSISARPSPSQVERRPSVADHAASFAARQAVPGSSAPKPASGRLPTPSTSPSIARDPSMSTPIRNLRDSSEANRIVVDLTSDDLTPRGTKRRREEDVSAQLDETTVRWKRLRHERENLDEKLEELHRKKQEQDAAKIEKKRQRAEFYRKELEDLTRKLKERLKELTNEDDEKDNEWKEDYVIAHDDLQGQIQNNNRRLLRAYGELRRLTNLLPQELSNEGESGGD